MVRLRRNLAVATWATVVLGALTLHVPSARSAGTVAPEPTTTVASVTPAAYVRDALDFIEVAAFRLAAVDWASIRARAEVRAKPASTLDEAHNIISDTLAAINDRHSSFTRPVQAERQMSGNYNGFGFVAVWPSRTVVTVAAGGPAAKAGLRLGDKITRVDGKIPNHTDTHIVIPRDSKGEFPQKIVVTITRKGLRSPKNLRMNVGTVTLISVPTAAVVEPPKIGGVVGAFGYVDVPGIIGDPEAQKQYAQSLHNAIRATDGVPRCGWVVDLRRNRGGYIYAMLNGLGPLLGAGAVAGQLNAAGTRTLWSYRDGTVYSGDAPTVSVDSPYSVSIADPAVAVLTSGLTASAGEAATIAFRGRANTRSFGEKTVGLTTFNVRKKMSDGAFLDILNAVDIDRNGTVYDGPVVPDQSVAIDWNNIATPTDPVITAATRWLSEQPSCRAT